MKSKHISDYIKDYRNTLLTQGYYISGISTVDSFIGGFQYGTFTMLGGAPSTGKTDFLLNLIVLNNLKKYSSPLLFFSLESKFTSLLRRLNQIGSVLGTEKNQDFYEDLFAREIYIEEQFTSSFLELKNLLIHYIEKSNVKIILIDTLDIFHITDENHIDNLNSKKLNQLLNYISKTYNVVVVASCWLNSITETRGGDRRPLFASDFNCEIYDDSNYYYADTQLSLYRPTNYGIYMDEEGKKTDNLCELTVIKNRNGKRGVVNLNYDEKLGVFTDW